MRLFAPRFFIAIALIFILQACSSGDRATPSLTPMPQISTQPTETPASIVASVTEVVATPTPKMDFFTEEFDAGYPADHWQSFNLGRGDLSNLVIEQEDSHLLFDLHGEDIYVYYMYTPYTYTNVSVKLQAENQGNNNNNISLVCRMNQDASNWYEFSVTSGGLWNLFAMDKHMYHIIGTGGTNFLKQGKEINEYQMVCERDEITLFINGQKVQTITDTIYGFREGFVGFNISSMKGYSVLPITVAIDSFTIDQP